MWFCVFVIVIFVISKVLISENFNLFYLIYVEIFVILLVFLCRFFIIWLWYIFVFEFDFYVLFYVVLYWSDLFWVVFVWV